MSRCWQCDKERKILIAVEVDTEFVSANESNRRLWCYDCVRRYSEIFKLEE